MLPRAPEFDNTPLMVYSNLYHGEWEGTMPVISSFSGMGIKRYFQRREHNPPHIHVIYGDYADDELYNQVT
jgi:hypothetical protein